MEESSEIKRKQNRLTAKTDKKKVKDDKAETKKKAKKVEKVEEKGTVEEVAADGQGTDEGPPLKKPKRKLRKPTAEEDIIDGFAILAFKNYEELSRAINLGENSNSRLCVQLLRRAEDGSVCKSVKEKKTSPKAKDASLPKLKSPPKPKSTTPKKKKESPDKMANKLPGSAGGGTEKKKRKSESAVGSPKKKQRANNGPTTAKENLHNIGCGTVTGENERVPDGCADLFATTRKDSSPYLLDNLHLPHEPTVPDPEESHINHNEEEKVSPVPSGRVTPTSSTTTSAATITLAETKPKSPPEVLETSQSKPHTNGPVCLDTDAVEIRDVNGHVRSVTPEVPERLSPPVVPTKTIQQTLFTPYATSAITRVSTPVGLSSGSVAVPDITTPDQQSTKHIHSLQTNSSCQTNSFSVQQSSLSDFTLSGSHIHRSSLPHYDKTGTGTGSNLLTSSVSQRNSTTPTTKDSPSLGKPSAATAFGSIARLLDSPNPPRTSSRNSPNTVSAALTLSTNDSSSINQFYLSGSGGHSSAPQSCSSRSLSPRSHSPPRERDSYSSNVSSLSRTSVTPVSGSSSLSQPQLPPNHSPLHSLSYSKAASWLSGVPPRLSPVPRPTPPPVLPPSSTGHLSSTGVPSHSGTTPSPLSVYPGLVSGNTPPTHGGPPPVPISGSAMFAPPMLPLSSIMSHPSTQSMPFGPSAEGIFQGQAQSELVRRDLESRFLGSERGGGAGGSQFLSRGGDLHGHHQHLLSHLSGVNAMSPHNQPGTNPALFPPMFKDMKLDSPFYRNFLPYPGFNGILPPPPPNMSTPFTSPSQMPSLTPKKTGKWNAMHVRIAWEIYQHQQKGGSDKNSSNSAGANSSQSKPSNPPPTSNHSSTTDLLRPPNHLFSGLNRPPEIGPPPFVSPLLSPHQTPHRGQFDPSQHPLFLHASQHLAPSLARYPGFGALGPTFGGLSGLGSSLLARDLANLNSMPSEQWQRLQRGAPFPGGIGMGPGWPLHRPEREAKTPTESRRHRDDRVEKRSESDRHSDTKGSSKGDSSPFRDRSPVRPGRTPVENGDTDSRSSRSSESHSTTVHSSKSRYKDDSNGDREKSNTPQMLERDRDKPVHSSLNDMKSLNYLGHHHPSRMYHPGSPMAPLTSGWESFPGFSPSGPRMSGVDSFRLNLLPLNERDKEYAARIQSTLMRPHYPNGPFMNLPLGGMGQIPSHPQTPTGGSPNVGSNSSSGNNSVKNSPHAGPIPLRTSPPNSAALHHSSSQNGCSSPSAKVEERGKDN